jgi:CO dehydrogenase maturation factor
MRVAFVGKGGAGKSALAGAFARALARKGGRVLAVDSDPMPGLAFSLGIGHVEDGIPDDAVVEKAEGEDGPRFRLRPDLTPAEAVERYAREGADGIRVLQFSKLRGHVRATMRSQMAFRSIVAGLPEDGWDMVGDLPGGARQAAYGWGEFAHCFLLVTEPMGQSTLAARRISRVVSRVYEGRRVVVVANKVRSEGDVELVAQGTGLEVVAAVPWDEELVAAEKAGLAAIDVAPGSAAVESVLKLVDRLEKEPWS